MPRAAEKRTERERIIRGRAGNSEGASGILGLVIYKAPRLKHMTLMTVDCGIIALTTPGRAAALPTSTYCTIPTVYSHHLILHLKSSLGLVMQNPMNCVTDRQNFVRANTPPIRKWGPNNFRYL